MPAKYVPVTKSEGCNVPANFVNEQKVEDVMRWVNMLETKSGGCNVPGKYVRNKKWRM